MKAKFIILALCACASAVFAISTAFAQAPAVYHPGDKIPYTVKFEGPNADKLTSVYLEFDRTGVAHKDQDSPPFQQAVSAWELKTIGPGVYEVTLEIQPFSQSGTYKLAAVFSKIDQFQHNYGPDLPALSFTVDNPAHAPQWPELKGVKP